MAAKWRAFIVFWAVFSLPGLPGRSARTQASASAPGRRKIIRLGTPTPKPDAATGGRTPGRGLPAAARRSGGHRGAKSASPPDVSVTCSASDLVVRVKPSFYGFGADAAELRLGAACRSNGVLGPHGDLLFTYPLTACDFVREARHGHLVYKFLLHYDPSPKRPPGRARPVDVEIECRYQRTHHVFQLAVRPTWQTAVVRKRLKGRSSHFQIQLMGDSWSKPVTSLIYQLGQTVHLQVSAAHLHSGGKLYISSCHAAPSSDPESPLKYTIIGNSGCLLDSERDPGASQFISRTDDTLRFSMKAFQFISDPDAEIRIHCKLSVTSEELGPAHKSCTFRQERWRALTGDDSICECCSSQCATSKHRRAIMEGFASSGLLLVSDQPNTADDGFLPASPLVDSMRSEDTEEHHSHDILRGEEEEEEEEEEKEEEGGYVGKEQMEHLEDEEGGRGMFISKEMIKPELETLDLRRWAGTRESSVFREEGSGYGVEEDFLESEDEEGSEGGSSHPNRMEGGVLRTWAQLEEMLPSLEPKDEDENSKNAGGSEEDVGGSQEATRTKASEVQWEDDDMTDGDAGELTWYFTWR